MRTWSQQQETIFRWFDTGKGNALVRARAGTGKTTTIIEGIGYAPETRVLLAAFNKRIATELQDRLPGGRAEAKTLHSIGFSFVKNVWKHARVDDRRGYRLAEEALGANAPDVIVGLVQRLAALGKNMVPTGAALDLEDIAVAYGCTPSEGWEDEGFTIPRVAEAAHKAMQLAREPNDDGSESIDFDDMIYLPVVNKWASPRYNLVVIDEAQDMNAAQLALALAVARGRICVVGDDRQAIYGFRGADSNALDNLKTKLEATEMGLTTTYRCGKVIVAYARTLVPDFQAADTNGEGEIVDLKKRDELFNEARPGDFVLSRTNAPLMSICLRFLREGRRARIEGRDIGQGLVNIVKKRNADSIEDLIPKLHTWKDREIQKARGKGGKIAESRIQTVFDQVETIEALMDGVASIQELLARISELFIDVTESGSHANTIVCSSIHKAKGLEADRVFILRETIKRTTLEEDNLHYVAVTRAKRTLVWVPGKEKREPVPVIS